MNKDIVILAAGVGSRLRPITNKVPKTMVEVDGIAIIERLLRQIETLRRSVNSVKIVSGYKKDTLKSFVEELKLQLNIEFVENVDYDTTNNMYSLYLALNELDQKNDLVIVNADCCYEETIVRRIIEEKGSYVGIDKSLFNDESMKVQVSKKNPDKIIGMSKALQKDMNAFVSIDLYTLKASDKQRLHDIIRKFIDSGDLNSWTEVALDILARETETTINCLDCTGNKWIEIDNHDDLINAKKIFS